MDVKREHPDLRWRQPLVPGRHMPLSPAMHGGNYGVQVPAIEPMCIRQVGGAHLRISLRVLVMTCRASREKNLTTRFDALDVFRRGVSRMSQRIDIGRDVLHLVLIEHLVAPEGR